MARRLVERGVRFVQVYHRGWDVHGNLPEVLPSQCRDVDQACYGAGAGSEVARHARRHAGHLGRRIRPHDLLARQADGRPTTAATIIRAASPCGWRAAASKRGVVHGETDEFSYNIVKDPVHVRDLQATHPAPVRHRSRAIHVQISGSRPEADWRRESACCFRDPVIKLTLVKGMR